MFDFFTKIIDEFGIYGLLVIVLGGIIYLTISKFSKKTEKSIIDLTDTMTTILSQQNTNLLNTLSTNSNNMQTAMLQVIDKAMTNRDEQNKDIHRESMNHRLSISEKIQTILYEMMVTYHAKRCGILEFHNSTNNFNGLSFLWYDMTYENIQKNIKSISGVCKNQQLSILTPVMKSMMEHDGIVVYRYEDIKSLEKLSPVLYRQLVDDQDVSTVLYCGLYDLHNNLIGTMLLEYDDTFQYPENIIDFTDIKEKSNGISRLLDFNHI